MKHEKDRSCRTLVALLVLAAFASMFITLCMGTVDIPLSETLNVLRAHISNEELTREFVLSSTNQIVWKLRLPRVLLGFAVGSSLALCGAVMQAIVQNPMAEPYILGISSGATLGATGAIFCGLSSFLGLFSFGGAALACFAVLALASTGGRATSTKLILSGMVINALFTAFSNFIISVAGDSDGVMSIKFWTMGSITRASWDNILLPIAATLAGAAFYYTQYRALNTMLLGDEAAVTLGVNIEKCRLLYLLVLSALTGIMVSCCGTIGFIGLIVPHVARSLIGNDHRKLIPVCALMGGIFLVWVDAFARTLVENSELPVGIFTALLGAPFFVYILVRRNYGFGGN